MRLTVGGDRIIYPGDTSAPVAFILDHKLIVNITISTPGSQLFFADIKNDFLNNPMLHFEYTKIPLQWFPQEIINQYNTIDLFYKDGLSM